MKGLLPDVLTTQFYAVFYLTDNIWFVELRKKTQKPYWFK